MHGLAWYPNVRQAFLCMEHHLLDGDAHLDFRVREDCKAAFCGRGTAASQVLGGAVKPLAGCCMQFA